MTARAVDVTLAEVARLPERFPMVYRESRRALLRRFPYAVYFVASSDLVSVVACMHARRDPRRWEERIGAALPPLTPTPHPPFTR